MSKADVHAALDWRSRRIDANDIPLSELLSEFSRYTLLPIRTGSAAIGSLRVSGVLRAGDLDALRATLKGAFGLGTPAEQQRFRRRDAMN